MNYYGKAWHEGYNAFLNAEVYMCPYEDGTMWNAWLDGYSQAEDDFNTGCKNELLHNEM